MAITAVAAVVGVAGSAAGYATVVAAAAAVVTVVGVATKNKTLMKIGAGLGIGGAAAGALGWSGAAASASSAGGAAVEGAAAAGAGAEGAAAATTAAEAATTATTAAEAASSVGATANTTGTTLRAIEGGSNLAYGAAEGSSLMSNATAAAPVATQAIQAAQPAPAAQAVPSSQGSSSLMPQVQPQTIKPAEVTPMAQVGAPGMQNNVGTSYWDRFSQFATSPGGMQVIGSTLSGVGGAAGNYYSNKAKIQADIDAENRLRANRSNFPSVRWSTAK